MAHARHTPRATAAFDGDRSLTYAELDARTNQLANTLQGRFGVGRGDRVAVLMRNRLEVAEAIGACAKAGAVYCGLNFRMTLDEYRSIIDNAGTRVLVTEAPFLAIAQTLAAEFGLAVLDVDDPSHAGYGSLTAASTSPPATAHMRRPDDRVLHHLHQRHHWRAKGIVFDARAVSSHAMVAALEYGMSASSRWLTAIPHNSSVQITLAPSFFVGGAVGFLDSRGFDPAVFAREATRHGATHTYLVRPCCTDPGGRPGCRVAGLAHINRLRSGADRAGPGRRTR